MNTRDITGRRFERLTVLRFDRRMGRLFFWECRCDCGNIKSVSSVSLLSGRVRSCGCLRREVSKSATKRLRQSLGLKTAYARMTVSERSAMAYNRLRKLTKESRARMLSGLHSPESMEASRVAIRNSPLCTGPNAVTAECWSLKDPNGITHQFRNLRHFIREHQTLFSPDRLVTVDKWGTTKAERCIRTLSPRCKRPRECSMGWTWHINHEPASFLLETPPV